jgi:hypothetical protein
MVMSTRSTFASLSVLLSLHVSALGCGGSQDNSEATGGSAGAGGTPAGAGGVGGTAPLDAQTGPETTPQDSPDADAQAAPSTCGEFAAFVCQKFELCAPAYLPTKFGTHDDCVSKMTDVCAHFEQAGRSVDKVGCMNAMTAPYCTAVASVRAVPDVCLMPRGTRPPGGRCNWAFDCESLVCTSYSGDCGTCAARAQAGDACDATHVCEPELVCNLGACGMPVAPGAGCNPASDMRCPAGTTCTGGVCKPWGTLGESCEPTSAPCDGPHGYYCSAGKCVTIQLAGQGEPCGSTNVAACRSGLLCKNSCVPMGILNGSCGAADASTLGCVYPLWCANAVCAYEGTSMCR